MKNIFFCLVFICTNLFGQELKQQCLAIDQYNFNAIYALSSTDYFASVNNAQVIYSKDGGITWYFSKLDSAYLIGNYDTQYNAEFSFFNTTDGLLISDDFMYSTNDGGKSWSLVTTLVGIGAELLDIDIVNGTDVFLIDRLGQTIYSNDKGVSWVQRGIPPGLSYFSSFDFKDESKGISISTNGDVYYTNNGGVSWSKKSNAFQKEVREVQYLSNDDIYTVSELHGAFKSSNAFTSSSRILYESLSGISVINESEIIISGNDDHEYFYKTKDGGQSWDTINVQKNDGMKFITSDIGLMYTDKSIYKTSDGGITWDLSFSSFQHNKNSHTDVNGLTWVGGGIRYRSPENPQLWSKITLDAANSADPIDISMLSESEYFILNSGSIRYTNNSGAQFFNISKPSGSMYSIHFFNSNVGVCLDVFGNLWRTVNKGQEWEKYSPGFNPNTSDVQYYNFDSIFYVQLNDIIYKSIDGGIEWEDVAPNPTNSSWTHSQWGTSFINSNEGYYTQANQLYYTIDGGLSWNKKLIDSNTDSQYGSVLFVTSKHGYVGGENGIILETLDGGDTWKRLFRGALGAITNMSALDSEDILVEGSKMLSILSGVNLEVGLSDIIIKGDNNLNVYPNPTRDWLNIENSNSEEVLVYDIKGNLVLESIIKNHKINTLLLNTGIYYIVLPKKGLSSFFIKE